MRWHERGCARVIRHAMTVWSVSLVLERRWSCVSIHWKVLVTASRLKWRNVRDTLARGRCSSKKARKVRVVKGCLNRVTRALSRRGSLISKYVSGIEGCWTQILLRIRSA